MAIVKISAKFVAKWIYRIFIKPVLIIVPRRIKTVLVRDMQDEQMMSNQCPAVPLVSGYSETRLGLMIGESSISHEAPMGGRRDTRSEFQMKGYESLGSFYSAPIEESDLDLALIKEVLVLRSACSNWDAR